MRRLARWLIALGLALAWLAAARLLIWPPPFEPDPLPPDDPSWEAFDADQRARLILEEEAPDR